MDKINDWTLCCEGRVASVQYTWGVQNQFPTPVALNPATSPPSPGDPTSLFSVYDLGDGTVALECHGGGFAWGQIQPSQPGYVPEFLLQFTWSNGTPQTFDGCWHLKPIPSGDGYFLLEAQPGYHVAIDQLGVDDSTVLDALFVTQDGGENADDQVFVPARFTAVGASRNSLFDCVEVSNSASGLSLAGLDLANVDLTTPTSHCVTSAKSPMVR
jgi:hypothetical protein